jgi:hypothetical protein
MPELFSGLHVESWWQSTSGLFLPCSVRDRIVTSQPQERGPRYSSLLWAERRDPLPDVAAYATPEALKLEPLPFESFRELLAEIPQNALLPILSDLQARLSALEHDQEKELQLAELVFGRGQALERLRAFVTNGEGRRTVFSEQGLTLLQWLAIAYCNENEVSEITPAVAAGIPQSVLGVMSYLEVASHEDEDQRSHRWLRHLTQNFAFNSSPVVGNAMARTWAIFGRLHRSANDLRPHADIDSWLVADYGLGLELQMALSFALYGTLSADDDDPREFKTLVKHEDLDGIFNQMGLSEEERASAMQLIAAPISHFRDEINGKTHDQLSWDQVTFMRHPLIQVRDDLYLLQSPRALIAWMVDGPYYRALDSARERGGRAVSAFTSRVGQLTERYVLELIDSAHPEPRFSVTGNVYGDKTYGRGARSSDVTITYPHDAVLIEVSSHRLSLQAKRDGDFEALQHDLTEMVGRRPRQLRRCIDAIKPLRRGHQATLRFPHLDPERLARIWPIIVTATPVHWSPLHEEFVGDELQGLESRPDVEPLDVLAIEDLESMLAIYEDTGLSVPSLLTRKASVVGARGDTRRWIARDQSIPNLARSRYLDSALKDLFAVMGRFFGLEDFDGEEASVA